MVLAHADAKVGFGPGWKHHVPAYVDSTESSFQSAECVKAAFTREAARPRKIATLRSKIRWFYPQASAGVSRW